MISMMVVCSLMAVLTSVEAMALVLTGYFPGATGQVLELFVAGRATAFHLGDKWRFH